MTVEEIIKETRDWPFSCSPWTGYAYDVLWEMIRYTNLWHLPAGLCVAYGRYFEHEDEIPHLLSECNKLIK